MKRVLHVSPLCGRAGTEAVIRFVIAGMAQSGVGSEAYFQRDVGGSDLFRELCPIHFEEEQSLEALLACGKFDAVHAVTSSNTIGLPQAVARSGFPGPVIAVCHNDYVTGWNRTNANGIVALTEWWARKIRPYTDLPVTVIGNPVDTKRFQPPAPPAADSAGKPILAWVGRTRDPWKNIERFKSILARLPAARYEVRVLDTDSWDHLRELFGELTSRIAWYGRVHYTGMPGFYQEVAASGGALLSTSDEEAFPMCVLEGMASGCAVVVPEAWGSEEIVRSGDTGFVYRRADAPGSVIECLDHLQEPVWREKIVRRARAQVVERFSLSAITQQYLAYFERAAALPRRRSPGARLTWTVRAAGLYARRPPSGVWLYRPRGAVEAIERALREHQAGRREPVRTALLQALRLFPPVYLKPWRAKFLLRTLLKSGGNA